MIVLSVVEAGLSKAEAARRFGVSWRWVHTLVQRYEAEGLAGLEPRSRRPHANPRATPEPVRIRILELREKLAASGLDAGPATIEASRFSCRRHAGCVSGWRAVVAA